MLTLVCSRSKAGDELYVVMTRCNIEVKRRFPVIFSIGSCSDVYLIVGDRKIGQLPTQEQNTEVQMQPSTISSVLKLWFTCKMTQKRRHNFVLPKPALIASLAAAHIIN